MSLARAFRLSFYLTLGLACTALALAEMFFLWWMGLFLVGILGLLVAAYRCEGRWELSADAANRLGMVIAIGAAFWILYNLPRTEEDLVAGGVPWPAGLLPHLGPLLMVLLLVKLFRPKRLADFWVIQTIGLMMVTLACVLAGEPMFGALLVIYLAALLWSLALFYLVREHAHTCSEDPGKLPMFGTLDASATLTLPWRLFGIGRVLRWTAGVVVTGVVLFVVAPRQGNWQWMPKQLTSAAKGSIKTGLDAGMDLNRVGKIELSDDPAFEVAARTTKGPKLNLDPDTRWFVQVLDYYANGRWMSWSHGAAPPHLTWGVSPRPEPLALPSVEGMGDPKEGPPDLKDDEFYLFFKVRTRTAGGLVLAEPIQGERLGLYPRTSPPRPRADFGVPDAQQLFKDRPQDAALFFHLVGTDTILAGPQNSPRLFLYGQVQRRPQDLDWLPAKEVNPRYRQFLVNQEMPERIHEFTRQVLERLPELTETDRALDGRGRLAPAARVKVARALCRYLLFSGEFGYSLELRRKNLAIDPLADFLVNVKEGHCERFAGGLTLMLRSVGIPARVIRGYRGVSPLEDEGPGKYVVRQNQAHSWVQALVPDPDVEPMEAVPGAEPQRVETWLTLDPTPATEKNAPPLLSWFGWLLERWNDSDGVWRTYVLEYNSDVQGRTLQMLWSKVASPESWQTLGSLAVGLALGFAAFLGLRSLSGWRRRDAVAGAAALTAGGTVFYVRFLDLAARQLDLRPSPGQTPREFSLAAAARLRLWLVELSVAALAAVPLELVELLYRVRFGDQPLTPAEQAQAERRVSELQEALSRAQEVQPARTIDT